MTLQYWGGFCHTSAWISHRCIPNPQLPTPQLSSPSHSSGQSQSTGVECPAPCIKLAMFIYFTEGNIHQFSQSVQSLSCVWLFVTLWITNSWSSLKLISIESVMPPSHLIVCRPLLVLPPIPPSIRVFSNESTLHMRWPKYWSFSFHIIPSKEHPGLISFRMDWLDLLAVQGTFKSLL